MLQMAGLSSGHDTAVTLGSPEARSTSVLCFRAGRLVAVESVNRPTGLARVEQRFAQDSSLEGAGFEPSVPRMATASETRLLPLFGVGLDRPDLHIRCRSQPAHAIPRTTALEVTTSAKEPCPLRQVRHRRCGARYAPDG